MDPRWLPAHGVLAAVLPASARTFRAGDESLAQTLAGSGATPGERSPDVEVATAAAALTGDAPCAIVFALATPGEGAGVAGRLTARLGGVARVAAAAAEARRRARALGYPAVEVIPFDQPRRAWLGPPRPADLRALPLGAVVAARRDTGPTILEAAGAAAGEPFGREAARVGQAGVVLVAGAERVLRCVLKAGDAQIAAPLAFLARLRDAAPPAAVAERIAWSVGGGELALARWSVEPRLAGVPASSPGGAFLDDCVEFLAALFAVALDDEPAPLAAAGELVAAACPPDLARRVTAIAAALDDQLAGVPRGVAHGDFWPENLLAADGRLSGVVDWSAARAGALPLLDLWHLLAHAEPAARERPLGDAVVGRLLPAAERGGGPLVAAYCQRIGLSPEPPLLRALAVAYWLEHVAGDLRAYADRRARPAWLARNVHAVAAAL